MAYKMPIPSLARSLEIGAAFIEHDLDGMRDRAQKINRDAQERPGDFGVVPLAAGYEAELMKAVEWATAAATLRALAAQAKKEEERV